MSDKPEGVYQEIPDGFVYLWKADGWREVGAGHSANFTLMERAEQNESISRGEDDRAA